MGYLQVRDFPEELHEELRLLAKKEHRSVSQQTIIAIREHVTQAAERARANQVYSSGSSAQGDGVVNYGEKRKKIFERIAAMPPIEVPEGFPSVVEIIQEGREERDAQIQEALQEASEMYAKGNVRFVREGWAKRDDSNGL
ncbi:MAG: hypothetical protein FWE41_03300 [Coriobacteriia bacterium]|nr:hypothetical protein [Coriobacteriia bacterium]